MAVNLNGGIPQPQRGRGQGDKARRISWGVPLGGIGTGCIELGNDSRFRNITINNNRDKATRISLSPRAFIALRTVRQGRVQTRFLQPDCALPFADAGIIPAFTPVNELTWRALYPCSYYTLNAKDATVETAWRALAPVVPHDVASSNTPVMFFSVSVRNPAHTPVQVSFVLNWENLCGCERSVVPTNRGTFTPVPYRNESSEPRFQGLSFGKTEGFVSNADGNYALIAQPQLGQEISVLGWNSTDASELDTFWQQFHYDGRLANQVSRNEAAQSAAVCCTRELEPYQECRFLLALSWYCPRFVVDGVDLGNKYAEIYRNAVEAGQGALRNVNFYFRAVEAWQNSLLTSSLPRWFSRMLINSCATFSTNSLLTRQGEFALFESPEEPMTGCLDKRLYSSLATLLLFPELEEAEFYILAGAMPKTEPGRCVRYLGRMTLHAPGDGARTDELVDLGPKFVLLASRNLRFTGNRKMAETLFPRLRAVMNHIARMSSQDDGLPRQSGFSTMYDDWATDGVNSYTSSLWIAAMRAYAALAAHLGDAAEAERYRALAARAVERFEALLWNEEQGYYMFCAPGTGQDGRLADWHLGCHTGQLAGEWYAQWLGLGSLFAPQRVARAVATIQRLNERKFCLARATLPDGYPCENPPGTGVEPQTEQSWPGILLAHLACLLLQLNREDHGFYLIERIFKSVWMKGARAFNHPLAWDCNANAPCGPAQDRHLSALTVWHAFESLHGVMMDAAEHVLWIRPHLPRGVRFLSVPLFSPTGLSWVRLEEKGSTRSVVEMQLAFRDPVLLREIVMRPLHLATRCEARCLTTRGVLETSLHVGDEEGERLLHIRLSRPEVVQGTLAITLTPAQR